MIAELKHAAWAVRVAFCRFCALVQADADPDFPIRTICLAGAAALRNGSVRPRFGRARSDQTPQQGVQQGGIRCAQSFAQRRVIG